MCINIINLWVFVPNEFDQNPKMIQHYKFVHIFLNIFNDKIKKLSFIHLI